MALKPVAPRDDSGAERERYERDLAHANAFSHLWANGPEHVPEQVTKRTVVTEEVRVPLAARDADRESERPVVVQDGTGTLPQADPDAGKSTKARSR